jgi:EmrB/QacA subfamily drug resistance transporter
MTAPAAARTPHASRARRAETRALRSRQAALLVLCMGELMIVLDTTIVNVALPSIRSSLGFSQTSLAWVVNGYTLSFGGFLLIAGRLGDLYGRRRWFTAGTALFTAASLLCGLSGTQAELTAARGIQGLAGAIVAATSLSLITSLFPEASQRCRAMALFGFVTAGGGCIGVLAGGVLTGLLDWHWIFLVNVPVGIAVCLLSTTVPSDDPRPRHVQGRLNVTGAVTVTAAITLMVYAIVGTGQHRWLSWPTLWPLTAAAGLAAVFVITQARSSAPLLSRRIARAPNFALANGIGILWAATLFAWFFFSALYLQVVLGYSPVRVGLAFLPASLLMAFVSLRLSARLVGRLGRRIPLTGGLILAAAGLALLARAPVSGNYAIDVLPAMLLFGVAGGIVLNPLLLAATSDIPPDDAGVASGAVNSSFMMGGALSLGMLATVSAARTGSLVTSGHSQLAALNGGYHIAFAAGGACHRGRLPHALSRPAIRSALRCALTSPAATNCGLAGCGLHGQAALT